MYKLYTDKNEIFECNVNLEGADLLKSKARLVLESNNYNLLFYGDIDVNGKCVINVPKLKSLLNENDKGTVKLEIIAEDTFFEPWNDNYEVITNKKVTVEVLNSNKPNINEDKKIKISNISQQNDIDKKANKFIKLLESRKINLNNIEKNKKTLKIIGEAFYQKYNLSLKDRALLINKVISKLK
jgi:hypothetical protein